jgi:hypothetical protein
MTAVCQTLDKYVAASLLAKRTLADPPSSLSRRRGTLAFSSIMGLREDNNLVGQQYALLGTVSRAENYLQATLGDH